MAASSRRPFPHLFASALLLLAARRSAAVRAGSRAAEEGDSAKKGCTDADSSDAAYAGWGCSFYDTPDKCGQFPDKFGKDFDPMSMCCVCGGGYYPGQEQTSHTPCPATCWGFTCDDWLGNGGGNTCESLTQQGCDCTGCTCSAMNASPDFSGKTSGYDGYKVIGEGYCSDAVGSQMEYERIRWKNEKECVDLCSKRGESCSGLAIDELGCTLYSGTIAASDGEYQTFCYAKVGPEQQLRQQSHEDEDSQRQSYNETTDAIAPFDGKQGASPPPTPLAANLVNEKYIQSYTFTKNRFMLEKRFELCIDSDGQCAAWSGDGYCTDPEYQEWMRANCRFSCNACEPPQRVMQSVALVSERSFSLHSSVEVKFAAPDGGQIKAYKVAKARMMGVSVNWRVMLPDDHKILYSIQKQSSSACKSMGLESCAVWHVYKGRTRHNTLVYLGVQRTSTFKFYKSLAELKQSPESSWHALVRIPQSDEANAAYKVTVMPGEDAGLLLIAAYVVNHLKDLIDDQGTSDFEDLSA